LVPLFGKEKLAEEGAVLPPIVLSIGGTGAAMNSKSFAETLAKEYGGPVLIYDRFNMGLSDNTTVAKGVVKNGMGLWLSQLNQMFDSDVVGLKGKKFHTMAFSMSTITQLHYVLQNPDRVRSVIFLSGILGAVGDPGRFRKQIGAFEASSSSSASGGGGNNGAMTMMKFVGPGLYKRAAGQVEEGADPDGLPVIRAMCRTKGFTQAFLEQMTDPTIVETSLRGATDESCRELAESGIPMYVRNYEDDSDVNLDGWSSIWEVFREAGGNASSEYEIKSGKHHAYYADDSARKIAAFARMANGE